MNFYFENRIDAGKKLGQLISQKNLKNPLILAVPRGGVVVGDEVAKILHAPMDVVIARKIAAPGDPEFGIGAISEDEIPHLNDDDLKYFNFENGLKEFLILEEKCEMRRRVELYRAGNPLADISGKTIVVVDDGLATGVTADAAANFLRTLKPAKLILAVPVGPTEISPRIKKCFDDIICLRSLDHLSSVGKWYREFNQLEDSEVLEVLHKYHYSS